VGSIPTGPTGPAITRRGVVARGAGSPPPVTTTTPPSPRSSSPGHPTPATRPGATRGAIPLAYGSAAVLVALGAIRALAGGSARPLIGALIFAGVVLALVVPMHLMQRSGRGIAAPMESSEARRSMVVFAGIQAVAAAAGAVWAAGAGHTVFAISLGAWVVLSLVGVVAALVGPRADR
jgi:hypothetical protein